MKCHEIIYLMDMQKVWEALMHTSARKIVYAYIAGLIDLNQWFMSWFKSSNTNHDLNQAIKI